MNGPTILMLLFALPLTAAAEEVAPLRPLQPVPFTRVKIEDEFWSPRIETNRVKSLPHVLRTCEETGRVSNFDKAAGKMPGTFEGIYFNDSDLYKALEGAAYAIQIHPDPALEAKLEEIIAKIAAAQQPDGYLNTYYILAAAGRLPEKMVEKGGRWSDLPQKHELYCAGHMFEAAVAHFQATGRRTFLDVARKYADCIDSVFGPDKRHGVPGHEEIELALVKLWRVTGEERYRKLAEFFVEERGRTCGRKFYGDYCQDHLPVHEQTDIIGHAVRAMYLYSAVADVAALTGDRGYVDAMERLWSNVTQKKMYVTGGIGHAAYGEGFSGDFDLPNDSAYAETCASIGLALWNQRLLLLHADGRFGDVVERVIYNGFLSGVSLDGGTFFYVNPLASRGHHHRQPWYSTACCPTNVVRFLPSIGGMVYGVRPDEGIWVNLYVAGAATLPLDGRDVRIVQTTRYPWDGHVKILVDGATAGEFTVALRIPGWCRGATASVAGEPVDMGKVAKGFLPIRRVWRGGDTIELDLPMEIERVQAHPAVADDRGRVALQRGPVVYCLEDADHGAPVRSLALLRETPLRAEHRPDLLGGVTVLRGTAVAPDPAPAGDALYGPARPLKTVALTAIPYYAWDHRTPGQMAVWIPESPGLAEVPPAPTRAAQAKATASHVWTRNTAIAALNDGVVPRSSADFDVPRCTWYPHMGTDEWVQYDFDAPQELSRAEAYWFDDGKRTKVPASWRVLYRDGDAWKPVEGAGAYGVEKDKFNVVRFKPVKTSALRLEAKLQENASAGMLEWRVE